MELYRTALTALCSVAALFAVTKLLGYRQMAQMSAFDYINGITIGSIAAELAVAEGSAFWQWLIALAVYAAVTLSLAVATNRSVRVRRAVSGRPIILLQNGKLYDSNFRRAHLDIHEFLSECRRSGYFDLSQIHTAVLEPGGSVSFLPHAWARPATPEDLALRVPPDDLCANVIVDGNIMEHNLKNMGFDRAWLERQLEKQRRRTADVFLATCGADGTLTLWPRAKKEHRDILA